MKYRILSFDGGGIRGLITTTLLERLEAFLPGVVERADMFAGTSTGGIIALGLAFGLTPAGLTQLYKNNGSDIFDSSFLHDIAAIGGLSEAKYDNVKLRALLTKTFGSATLGSLKKKVVIPTLDLNATLTGKKTGKQPLFMHNLDMPGHSKNVTLVEAALRTSAAPTYFPTVGSFVDGGVVANDPSMCALGYALNAEPITLRDVVLLSLGTGSQYSPVPGADHDWGLTQWAPKIVDMILDGNVELAEEHCPLFLGERYMRCDPELIGDVVPLDAWKRSDELVKVASQVDLTDQKAWLTRLYAQDIPV